MSVTFISTHPTLFSKSKFWFKIKLYTLSLNLMFCLIILSPDFSPNTRFCNLSSKLNDLSVQNIPLPFFSRVRVAIPLTLFSLLERNTVFLKVIEPSFSFLYAPTNNTSGISDVIDVYSKLLLHCIIT